MSATELLPAAAQRTELAPIDAVLLMYRDTANPLAELLGRGLASANVRVRYKKHPDRAFRHAAAAGRPRVLHIQWVHYYFSRPSIARTLRSGAAFLAQVARKKRQGVRLVWTVHDIHFPESRHVTTEHLLQALLARIVDGMIVRSRASAQHTGEAFRVSPERMSVIPHGHYADWYPNTVSRRDARTQLGIPQGDTVFLFFGAVRAYKGLPQLFDAFRRIQSRNVTLIVAGLPWPEELEAWTLAQAARDERVRAFPQRIAEEEVQLHFNAADAFVLPVRDDSTAASGTVGLAATFGRAIIAPDQRWIVDPMPRDGTIVYDSHDPDGLRAALERALDADLAAMGERNREHIMPWGWDRIGLLTRRVYEGERIRAAPKERDWI